MTFPVFAPGDVLTAADMNAVGWWLVKSDTVAAASASHICTNAFTASYTDYLILVRELRITTGSTTAYTMQLRSAGSTTTTNYASAGQLDNFAGASRIASSATAWTGGYVTNVVMQSAYMNISNPQTALRCTMSVNFASEGAVGSVGGYQNSTTAFDSFVLTPAASTFAGGTIKVYGYKA